jgi:hypothetical protein
VARHGGGDVLWLAYVPEGLRAWFRRFADSVDPSLGADCPFRVVRLFDAPGLDEIAFLASRIRSRTSSEPEETPTLGTPLSSDVRAAAEEIVQGRLHLTTIVLDVHHVGTFLQRLRAAGGAAGTRTTPSSRPLDRPDEAAIAGLFSLLDSLKDARLNVLFTTPLNGPVKPAPTLVKQSPEAIVLKAIDARVDVSVVVGAEKPPPDRLGQLHVRIEASVFPELAPTADFHWADWSDQLAAVWLGGAAWRERLASAYPRSDQPPSTIALRESAGGWQDATQEEFGRWAQARGWTVTLASADQDRGEHWDLGITRGSEAYRVDVKAPSRIRRRDAATQDDWHWVELRGVVDEGWLFGGKADLIAFQTRDSFVLVRRAALIAHVCHHVLPENQVSEQRRAEYRVYHRKDAAARASSRPTGVDRGVLTLIPTNRLRLIAWDEWTAEARPRNG